MTTFRGGAAREGGLLDAVGTTGHNCMMARYESRRAELLTLWSISPIDTFSAHLRHGELFQRNAVVVA